MAKRIDYEGIVGLIYTNKKGQRYKVLSWDKNGSKNVYKVGFLDNKNIFLVSIINGVITPHIYYLQSYKSVIEGKCKDLITDKQEKKAETARKLKERTKLSRVNKENYIRIPDLKNKTILSLDGSTNATGWALFFKGQIITGVIVPPKGLETRHRMAHMRIAIDNLIVEYGVDVVFYEDVIFKNINVMKVLGRLQGHIESIVPLNCEFVLINPSSWKSYHGFKGERTEQKKNSIIKAERELKRTCGEDEADAYNMLTYCLERLEKR